MIFRDTSIPGACIVEPQRHEDARGFFARTWDSEEFASVGLSDRVVQTSVSFNRVKGTLRGLHYQSAPHQETKLVRCTAGAVYDVVVDLRPDSPAFRGWVGVELSAENRLALYVPEGCAHGFLTLRNDSEVAYQMSSPYVLEAARGVRYDDPAFGITWPCEIVVVNERDASYSDFAAEGEAPHAGREYTTPGNDD
jgi:dTDP-4-dehydrorhamnose 3,5-epimerase